MTDILVRAVPTELTMSPDSQVPDARVIEARLVPYGQVADVADYLPDGTPERYREAFSLGSFARQCEAAQANAGVARRVTFLDQHEGGLGKVGYALSLREQPDGLYGALRVFPDKVSSVQTLLGDGVDGLSVGFVALRTQRQMDGTRVRTRASLIHVALEAEPAYTSARVLSMRAGEDEASEGTTEADEAILWRSELDAWLAADEERREALANRMRPVA